MRVVHAAPKMYGPSVARSKTRSEDGACGHSAHGLDDTGSCQEGGQESEEGELGDLRYFEGGCVEVLEVREVMDALQKSVGGGSDRLDVLQACGRERERGQDLFELARIEGMKLLKAPEANVV